MKRIKKVLSISLLLLSISISGCSRNNKQETLKVEYVQKIETNGLMDTYEIAFSDGTKATFTVTNGKDGESGKEGTSITSVEKTRSQDLIDVYTITFSNGKTQEIELKNGRNGEVITILNISKISTLDNVDTYKIMYTDGNSFTFDVVNGSTPYIGPNGNWWIGDKDTGEFAAYNYETRDITDGLTFTPMTINGASGLVVSAFDSKIAFGDDVDDPSYGIVNIPDYVGVTPVIGVKSNLFNDSIKKVSLSKNTVYLENNIFKECKSLEEIDFNGAELEKIPDYAFYKTALKEVKLPDTIKEIGQYAFMDNNLTSIVFPDSLTKIGHYSFDGNNIKDLDINNVKYFGDYSLSGVYGKSIYLENDVEYVGNEAFDRTFVYTEYETIPSTWGISTPKETDEIKYLITNCKKNQEYIYSKTETGVVVYDYIGDKRKIEVANKIDGLPVVKIGCGFNSNVDEPNDIEEFPKYRKLEEVIIPNSVKEIENGSFWYSSYTMVYIPASIEKMGQLVGYGYGGTHIIFESNVFPGFIDETGKETTNCFEEFVEEGIYHKGISYKDIYYNSETQSYYQKDMFGLSLLACFNLEDEQLIIESKVDNKNVHTIKTGAFVCIPQAKSIIIEDGINKIQKNSFYDMKCDYIFISSSVTIINANGFDDGCFDIFYTSHSSKPSEWDSQWITSSSSLVFFGIERDKIPNISDDREYLYYVSNDNTISLFRYLYSTNISRVKVPRTLDGYTVRAVLSDCYTLDYSSTIYIYIPETVLVLKENSFYRTYNGSASTYVYFEAEGKLSGYNDSYLYTTRSIQEYFGRDLGY